MALSVSQPLSLIVTVMSSSSSSLSSLAFVRPRDSGAWALGEDSSLSRGQAWGPPRQRPQRDEPDPPRRRGFALLSEMARRPQGSSAAGRVPRPRPGSRAPGKDTLLGFHSGSRRVTALVPLNTFFSKKLFLSDFVCVAFCQNPAKNPLAVPAFLGR